MIPDVKLMNIPLLFTRRTHDRYTLRHHDLISNMCVQIPTTHETRLRRMRMDPTQDHEFLAVTVVEIVLFVDGFACIAGGGLFGDEEASDE